MNLKLLAAASARLALLVSELAKFPQLNKNYARREITLLVSELEEAKKDA